jgi:hypothetical protein
MSGMERSHIAILAFTSVVLAAWGSGCSQGHVGYLTKAGARGEHSLLKRSDVYRSDDAWVFCASDMRQWSSVLAWETAFVGPALCIVWRGNIEDRTTTIGEECRLFLFRFYQPSYSLEEARAGNVQMRIDGERLLTIRFCCDVAGVERFESTDRREMQPVSCTGEVQFINNPRPITDMPFVIRRALKRRLRHWRASEFGGHET